MKALQVEAPDGIGEVVEGTDLTALILDAFPDLASGDVLSVTSKIVSKAEGRIRTGAREEALAEETLRVVARRGDTVIVQNRLGLVMAAAGIDNSNVPAGSIALLPVDPDGTARQIREEIAELTGHNVGLIITDTAGRAWRNGQTDLAIGVAGLSPTTDHSGLTDSHGNLLAVTAPAVVDEIAAAGELVRTKLGRRPVARLRGLAELVLPRGRHGPGAVALTRPSTEDLFSLGSREAVLAVLRGDRSGFGAVTDREVLIDDLRALGLSASAQGATGVEISAPTAHQVWLSETVALASGWLALSVDSTVTLRRADGQPQ